MNIQLSDHFTYLKLVRFTLPTMVMMIFTSVYGIVDGIFVSNFVGSSAFASVNLIMPALMMPGSLGFLFGTGGSAIVAYTLGEGDHERANRYFSMLVYVEIAVGIGISALGLLCLSPIIRALGATERMVADCRIYGGVLLLGLTAFMLQNTFQSFFVAAEKPQLGLAFSLAAGFTNILFDFLLIYVCRMGVLGAALATVLSQMVGGLVPLLYFSRKNSSLLRLTRAKPEARPIVRTAVNGSSEMISNLSLSLVNMLYNLQLMRLAGAGGVSAYGIIMYSGFVFYGIFLGYSIGSAPLIAYHFGAQNLNELRSLLRKSLLLMFAAGLVMTALAELSAQWIAGIFVGYDADLLQLTIHALQLYSLSYLLSWFPVFVSAFFTALNNGLVSALISFVRTLVFESAMVLLLPVLWGLNGIWLAVVFAEALSLLLSLFFLLRCNRSYHYLR